MQAAVFSDFNLGAPSSDLIHTDFIASAYASARTGQASAFARVYHQSSHLGDEFLLRRLTDVERINLSYEGADLRLSYELPYGLRVYGGGGGIFYKEPSTLKPWMIQYGMEYRSPWRIVFASICPVAAVDIKNHEQNNWKRTCQHEPESSWTGFSLSAAGFSSSLSIFVATLPPANFCGSASTIWELGRTTTFRMTHLNTIVKSCKHIVPQR